MNPDGYIELANIYIALGDEEKAVETLQRSMEQLPDNAEIRTLLENLEFTNKAESKEDEVDWRQIYFDSYHEIVRDAVTYTGSNFTETEIDSIDSMRLADINFDGMPELTICPYSPTGTYGLIYMIIEGQVKRVFSDSFNEYSWQLKRNTTSGEYEYVLHTNIGAYGWDNGGLYIMMPQINL